MISLVDEQLKLFSPIPRQSIGQIIKLDDEHVIIMNALWLMNIFISDNDSK